MRESCQGLVFHHLLHRESKTDRFKDMINSQKNEIMIFLMKNTKTESHVNVTANGSPSGTATTTIVTYSKIHGNKLPSEKIYQSLQPLTLTAIVRILMAPSKATFALV